MDPNPVNFPFLSYVLSQYRHPGTKPTSPSEFSDSTQYQITELLHQRPHLNNPKLIDSMIHAVSDVARTRSLLQTISSRPDPSAVDAARAKIAGVESDLSRSLEEISMIPCSADRLRMETERRQAAQREVQMYKAVLRFEELHEAYEKQLRDAEERLVEMYNSAAAEELVKDVDLGGDEQVNEEVVGIIKEASTKTVERVELSGRQLRFLPEAFLKLHGLVLLDLSHNQLEVIPDSIAGLQNLEELNVSSNLLNSLPDSVGLLINLKVLDLSGNKLDALPESIALCSSLVELDASFNNLMYLPTNIGYGLVNLRRLLIHLNKICCLPISICEMKSLRYLDVHFNELRGLPPAIGRMTNLEVLNLSSNFSDLTELPETVGDLTNLRELDLSNNQIHALPDTFGQLENLSKLNLDQNPVVIPPMEIVSKGVEAVKEFMTKRRINILAAEEQRSVLEANYQTQSGWLEWGTSMLNNFVSGVSRSVAGYLGGGQVSRDPYLDRQL